MYVCVFVCVCVCVCVCACVCVLQLHVQYISLFHKLNTMPSPPEKFRTQVIKTFSIQESWWYIGIKGDGGVKSKGTKLLIENEIDLH